MLTIFQSSSLYQQRGEVVGEGRQQPGDDGRVEGVEERPPVGAGLLADSDEGGDAGEVEEDEDDEGDDDGDGHYLRPVRIGGLLQAG